MTSTAIGTTPFGQTWRIEIDRLFLLKTLSSFHASNPAWRSCERAWTPGRVCQLSMASREKDKNTPSPWFSIAGSQVVSRASGAGSTSRESSPSMSGMAGSKRVKPNWATTSRRR